MHTHNACLRHLKEAVEEGAANFAGSGLQQPSNGEKQRPLARKPLRCWPRQQRAYNGLSKGRACCDVKAIFGMTLVTYMPTCKKSNLAQGSKKLTFSKCCSGILPVLHSNFKCLMLPHGHTIGAGPGWQIAALHQRIWNLSADG